MNRTGWLALAALAVVAAAPTTAIAGGLSVEVWTRQGHDAVYQPGDLIEVKTRTNAGAHLLIYEIDAEGYLNVLFPYAGRPDWIDGGRVLSVPDYDSGLELVAQGPVGQGYIVAVASEEPFGPLPWYLRPFDDQAVALGYHGEPDDEEGITAEGRIVGDPFVAMEKIRRRLVENHLDPNAFATAYTSYYLHDRVKYPRYLCYDCHRPRYWSWWDGFDPYYASCSAFSFRVNYSWVWGPSYWFGHVPYYVYVCSPGYGWNGRTWYSSWYGWGNWCGIWGGPLRRYKSPPPPGYVPPARYKDWREGTPPGLLTHNTVKRGVRVGTPVGHNVRDRGEREPRVRDEGRTVRGVRDGTLRQPLREVRGEEGDSRSPRGLRRSVDRQPAREIRGGEDRGRRIQSRDRGSDRQPVREIRGRDDRGRQILDRGGSDRQPAQEIRSDRRYAPRGSERRVERAPARRIESNREARPPRRVEPERIAPRRSEAPAPARKQEAAPPPPPPAPEAKPAPRNDPPPQAKPAPQRGKNERPARGSNDRGKSKKR